MNITIIGIGNVGSALAFGLILKGIGETINIVDIDKEKLNSEFLDLKNCIDVLGIKTKLNKYSEIQKSDIYILTAGRNTSKAERDKLYDDNKIIAEHYFKEIAKLNPTAWVLVVTNPSHKLAQLGLNYLQKVIPIGNMLDNARYKSYHLFGKHEAPVDLYKQIKKGKGYTNWGCVAEVIKLLFSITNTNFEVKE